MERLDIESTLKTFRVVADTREQSTAAARKRFDEMGVMERATLSYGDYCAQITLPERELHDLSGRLSPPCVVERKMSLDELAACLTRDRDRFRREFERAGSAGARVYLLVENGSWEAIINHRYRSKLHPNAFLASLTAWMIRYGFAILFCRSDTSGRLIKEVLYRDIKERLEGGEYG